MNNIQNKRKRCRNCRKDIAHLHGARKYCDDICRQQYAVNKSPAVVYGGGRRVKARSPISCEICNMPFNPANDHHVVCSEYCRVIKARRRTITDNPKLPRDAPIGYPNITVMRDAWNLQRVAELAARRAKREADALAERERANKRKINKVEALQLSGKPTGYAGVLADRARKLVEQKARVLAREAKALAEHTAARERLALRQLHNIEPITLTNEPDFIIVD